MTTREICSHSNTSASRLGGAEFRAAVVGALSGGVVGAVANSGTVGRGLLVFLAVAVPLTALFALTAAKLGGRGPGFVRRTALSGLFFGVLAGVGLSPFAVSVVVNANTSFTLSSPLGNRTVLAGWAAYGLFAFVTYCTVLGTGYGVMLE